MVQPLSWFLIAEMMIVFFWNINPCRLVRRYQSLGVTCCLHLQYSEQIAVYAYIPTHRGHLDWNPHNTTFFFSKSYWEIITEIATQNVKPKPPLNATLKCDLAPFPCWEQWYDAVSIFRVSIVRGSVSSKPMRCSGSRRCWVQNSVKVRISVCAVSF
jgi:hypothetical protein